MIRLVVIAAIVLVPASALGQAWGKKECVEGKPKHCVQALAKGEVSPFIGQLYTPELAIEQSLKVHSFDTRLRLETRRIDEVWRVKLNLEKKLHEIDNEASKRAEDMLLKSLEDSQPPFYERPSFVIPMTAVVVAGVIFGAMAISAEMGKAVKR